MLGLVLLYVGAVLALNGIWLLGGISDREIAIMNIFSGAVGLSVALTAALRNLNDISGVQSGAEILLFAFTYLWVAYNRYAKTDERGLGWYCLFVSITAVPTSIWGLAHAHGIWQWWQGANWAAWALLWFLYWFMLVPKRIGARAVGVVTIAEAVLTCWIPAWLVLFSYLK